MITVGVVLEKRKNIIKKFDAFMDFVKHDLLDSEQRDQIIDLKNSFLAKFDSEIENTLKLQQIEQEIFLNHRKEYCNGSN